MAVTPANKIVRGDDLTTVAQEIDKYFQRKATGKGLSTNDYTTDEKTKLAGIESGAQKNVKPDWNAASGTAEEILNKPTIPADKVFIATYGTTTYAQVKAACDAGKVVVAKSGNTLHLLSGSTSTTYRFSTFDSVGTVISSVTVENNNVWGGNDIEVAQQESVENALDNKADKSTTLAGYGITNAYTKTEVNTAISNALKGGYVVVATLPTASADTLGKIYLVPMTDTEDSNVKEEYVTWLDGSTYKWEKLGTTQFDNSDYEERLTAAEITTLLNL